MLQLSFSWYDYALFASTLGISLLIGIYFGVIKKQESAKDYLLGGQQMSVIPVAMSLVASCISGLTILGVPSDVYKYGANYWFVAPDMIFVVVIVYYVYYPVFYKLQIKSMNEYLKLRFDDNIQIFASAMNLITMTFYLPIVIYIPALALSQATGFNIHLITPIICGICIIYTTLGGIKAVIWADTLQFVLMMVAIVTVFLIGVMSLGGFSEVWRVAQEHGRIQFDSSLDFTKRDTLLSGIFALTVTWTSYISANQVCVQKCMSLPNYKSIKYVLILFCLGMMTIVLLCVFTGLLISVKYKDCDPIKAGLIERADQLLPYYVLDVARKIPGLSGLFVSGICSAALSTLAAVMNGMSCTIYEDFISRFVGKNISEKKVSFILKCLVVMIGVINTALVFIVEHLGGLLALSFSLAGITSGTLLGLFSTGMLIPMVSTTGALWGGIVSMVAMAWVIFGQQWYQFQGKVVYPVLPLYTNGCTALGNINETVSKTLDLPYVNIEEVPFVLYRVSFYWYTLMGLIIFVIVSVTVSYFKKEKFRQLNKDLFSPVIHSLLPQEVLEKPYSPVQEKEEMGK